jgi:hypothetical protein
LRLIAGDRLELQERCGDWVKAICVSTSCVGICPFNRVFLLSDDAAAPFDLLLFEASCLFRHLFSKRLILTRYPDGNDRIIFQRVQHALGLLPLQPANRTDFATASSARSFSAQ